jgi:hypothetical protein
MAKKIGRPKKVEPYEIKITFADKVLRGEGETMLDALRAIEPPIHIFLKGTIRVRQGDREFTNTYMPVKMRRIFRPLAQNLVAKELSYMLR